MADFDKINIDSASYNVKDTTARESISEVNSNIQGQIAEINQDLAQETSDREAGDSALQTGIGNINSKLSGYQNIDAVTFGIDNTGESDVSNLIATYLATPMANHYFPSGKYRLDAGVTFPCYNTSNGVQTYFSAASDAKFFANSTMGTMFTVTGAGPGDGVIDGGVFDGNSKANIILQVDGVGAPGFQVRNSEFRNALQSCIVIGSANENYAGHQRLINCKVYNDATLASGVRAFTPDVKIYECEIYYTKSGIYTVKDLFVASTHIWSGGSLLNSANDDYAISVDDDAELTLTDVFLDSFSYGVYAPEHVIVLNAENLWLYNDAERTFLRSPTYGVYTSLSSVFTINGYCNTTANAKIMPVMYDNIYQYCLQEENKFLRRCNVGNFNMPVLSPYYDISTRNYPLTILNHADTLPANTRRLFGYVVPSENSHISFTIYTGTGNIEISENFSRSTGSLEFANSKNNSKTFTIEIGQVETLDVGNQQVLACPMYIKSSTEYTGLSGISINNNGSSCWVDAFYNQEVSGSPTIIGTLSPT